jgi:hypothetical protein
MEGDAPHPTPQELIVSLRHSWAASTRFLVTSGVDVASLATYVVSLGQQHWDVPLPPLPVLPSEQPAKPPLRPPPPPAPGRGPANPEARQTVPAAALEGHLAAPTTAPGPPKLSAAKPSTAKPLTAKPGAAKPSVAIPVGAIDSKARPRVPAGTDVPAAKRNKVASVASAAVIVDPYTFGRGHVPLSSTEEDEHDDPEDEEPVRGAFAPPKLLIELCSAPTMQIRGCGWDKHALCDL